jgi:hypothetical protein
MTAPHSPTKPDDTQRKTDVDLTNVIAAALAAVTAAVLGSVLGAAGTIIGAAGASVITTVGTAVYRSSLERSRDSVRSLAHRSRQLHNSGVGSRTERTRPAASDAPLRDEQFTDNTDHRTQRENHFRRFAPLRWGAVVLGALGAFLLAMMLITGFEWASGEAIGGNGNGTTIGHVINDQPSAQNPPAQPSPQTPGAPASETSTPTPTPTTPDTSTTAPSGTNVEPSPTITSTRPSPSTQSPIPPLIPSKLPGVGN